MPKPVTRREFDALAARLGRLDDRLETIDINGTRGQAAVQVQITELARDMGELRGDQRTWQENHDRLHHLEQQQRVAGRRWLITVGIAGVAALGGLYPLIAVLLSRH
jgi:hypothetical protein